MRTLLLLLILIFSSDFGFSQMSQIFEQNEPFLSAIESESTEGSLEFNCQNYSKLKDLASLLENKDEKYSLIENLIYEASCVDPKTDSPDVIKRKINQMWDNYGVSFKCNIKNNMPTGSIIFLAINSGYIGFIERINQWGLNLNKTENGMNLLDHLDQWIINTKEDNFKYSLIIFRNMLINAGAKRLLKQSDSLSAKEKCNCPNPGRMDRICHVLGSFDEDPDPNSNYHYLYEKIVDEAACVDPENDSKEVVAQKVNAMWDLYGANLRCGPMGTPPSGSPLRFAIHRYFNDFISKAISQWKLDLNKIENDMTMLDFLEYRIERAGPAAKKNLEAYRESFIRAGAKRKSEL